jgi:hypothetical protein
LSKPAADAGVRVSRLVVRVQVAATAAEGSKDRGQWHPQER